MVVVMAPEATQADVDGCNKSRLDPKCGPQYTGLLACAEQSVTCGPNGKADTARFQSVCKAQVDAYTGCLSGH